MKKRYTYETCCVHSTAEKIGAMTEAARPVTLRTLARHCAGLAEWARAQGYSTGRERGLRLKDDWAVSFHKSSYDGRPCYYIDHSRIEYVWTREAA